MKQCVLYHRPSSRYMKFDGALWTQKSKEKHFYSQFPVVLKEQTEWSPSPKLIWGVFFLLRKTNQNKKKKDDREVCDDWFVREKEM